MSAVSVKVKDNKAPSICCTYAYVYWYKHRAMKAWKGNQVKLLVFHLYCFSLYGVLSPGKMTNYPSLLKNERLLGT